MSLCLGLAMTVQAKDDSKAVGIPIEGLQSIGAVESWSRTGQGVLLQSQDLSQVSIALLAPDLIRVRASFTKPLAASSHSWAIEKTDWGTTPFSVSDSSGVLTLRTAALEVHITKEPLLIDFRDAKSGQVIQADSSPMATNPYTSAILARKALGFDEHFYGMGEKAAHLDKRRGLFTMWTSDTPAYKEGTDPLYQSIPFYLGWKQGRAYGLFFDNSYRSYFDLGQTSQRYASFGAEGGEMDYYFFSGPAFSDILARYTELTGRMPMPPRWALGNQQSRWSYYPASVAEDVVQHYREADLPLDVLHLDIDYMDGYRVFTWNPDRFPDPGAFVQKLAGSGVKVVTIVDPGVKYQPNGGAPAVPNPELGHHDRGYSVFDNGLAKDYFLRRIDGSLYVGQVWPGDSVFVDYTIDAARGWWGDLHTALIKYGVAGIWNDMNEPSDFVDQTGASQSDVVYYDGGLHTRHAKNRNVYGMLMSRGTYEGLLRARPRQRPYVISRSGYAGIQRYATMWTGDTTSTWKSLALSVPMFQTLGMSGEPFVGGDIGGFMGRADYELLVRWYQVAFLTPFCRNHKVKNDYDSEPFRYPQFYQAIVRKYLKLRYRLLPYLYTVLEEAHRTGMPFFRPLLLNYPADADTVNLDDQFMVGSDLLAAPILHPGRENRLVYLPRGEWVDYWTGESQSGPATVSVKAPLDTVPLFVRAGAILPLGPEVNFVGEKATEPIDFRVYPDTQGKAVTSIYEDDGLSTDYQSGTFRRTQVTFQQSDGKARIEIRPTGSYSVPARLVRFYIPGSQWKRISWQGKELAPLAPGATEATAGWGTDASGFFVRIEDRGTAQDLVLE
jgi:alpha-glucosidase